MIGPEDVVAPEPAPAPASGPTCAVHPESPADAGTCARCGTFMCAACVAPDTRPPVCEACYARLEDRPMLRQANVLAIVLIVHGGVLAAMALLYVVYAFGLLYAFGTMPEGGEPLPGAAAVMPGMMVIVTAVEAALHLVTGGLQIYGGIQARKFQKRWAALTSLFLGLLTLFGCYCFPTSFLLLCWGGWVLFHEDVVQRYAVSAS